MALLASEVQRVRYELGYNVMDVTAEPWIGVTQLFEQVVGPFVKAGASTTSGTAVTAVAAGSAPAFVSLTLASATGFSVGNTVVVDVDMPDDDGAEMQERTIVRSLSGAVVTVALQRAHSGTYPVTVEGGESIIRDILRNCRTLGRKLFGAADRLGVERADEVSFFAGHHGVDARLERQLRYWRNELASAIGCVNLRDQRAGGGSAIALY